MRALITGIEGFTGRYMVTELERAGYQVFGTCAGGTTQLDGRLLRADLLDIRALEAAVDAVRPDVVVHLAAIAFVGHGNASSFYHTNVVGTRNLLAALVKVGCKPRSVLLASSANVYGNTTNGVLDESTPPNPANDYAVSKLAMEYMARLWLDRLPIVIARPFNYTGVGQSQDFLIPKIVGHFQCCAARIELGNLDVWRDFSDVRALAEAYRRLLEVDATGQIVNVCSGRTLSLRQVLSMMEKISGHFMEVEVNPAFVRAGEVKTLGGNPRHLCSLIGEWSSPPLEQTLAWMLKNGQPGES